MSPTLMEGAIAVFLVLIAWRIGCLLAPWFVRRFRRPGPDRPDRKNKPPFIIDT